MSLHCTNCQKQILEGEPFWSVNVHNEVFDKNTITVLDALWLVTLCEICAKLHDLNTVPLPMKTSCPSCGGLSGFNARHCRKCSEKVEEAAVMICTSQSRKLHCS